MRNKSYKYGCTSMSLLRQKDKIYNSLISEEWLFESQAKFNQNLIGGSSGFLSLSNMRLVFEPALTSLMSPMVDISINDIILVKKTCNLLIFPNSFQIVTKNNKYKFTTWSRNMFINLLKDLRV